MIAQFLARWRRLTCASGARAGSPRLPAAAAAGAEPGQIGLQGPQSAGQSQQPAGLEKRVANPSVAQSCHTDALHCIFAFLDLKDRANVVRSCRDWQLAVDKEPPRDLSMEIPLAASRVSALLL